MIFFIKKKFNDIMTTEFVGYDRLVNESEVTVLTTESELVEALTDGEIGTVFVKETAFYATMGGQIADFGQITKDGAVFTVTDTIKLKGGKIGHVGVVESGMFAVGDTVTPTIDSARRNAIGKNHRATHLLQEALRQVLGSHVEQAGSLVTPDRLRFDFTHFSAMSKEEIAKVEAIVNEQIAANLTRPAQRHCSVRSTAMWYVSYLWASSPRSSAAVLT